MRIATRTLWIVFRLGFAVLLAEAATAQELDAPVMERASDDLDTCALGRVTGLKADGDGFLAVRSGPASGHRKLDELHNGDRVWLFDRQGQWIGIVYGVEEVSCDPIEKDRIVPHAGRKGWVHENWVEIIAG
ncbi:MAG: hypothetical protein MnENMB40S_12080 [Rhizobiaceae bacterium MnEN-MB40S]|nr:MAG: hypothetical protein MnENMB40S_12080 [Rhizobiaceae bacterium MnEN-MB40S]